ncbi:MAG: STAS domain-containing protein [Planctomycetales bacterium]
MMLQCERRDAGEVSVLSLSGRLVFGAESQAFNRQIRELAAQGRTRVLLNLTQVSFIDSCGVGELVAGYTTLTKAGGGLKLASPQKFVEEVLRIARLPRIVDLFATEGEGLAAFAAGESQHG